MAWGTLVSKVGAITELAAFRRIGMLTSRVRAHAEHMLWADVSFLLMPKLASDGDGLAPCLASAELVERTQGQRKPPCVWLGSCVGAKV